MTNVEEHSGQNREAHSNQPVRPKQSLYGMSSRNVKDGREESTREIGDWDPEQEDERSKRIGASESSSSSSKRIGALESSSNDNVGIGSHNENNASNSSSSRSSRRIGASESSSNDNVGIGSHNENNASNSSSSRSSRRIGASESSNDNVGIGSHNENNDSNSSSSNIGIGTKNNSNSNDNRSSNNERSTGDWSPDRETAKDEEPPEVPQSWKEAAAERKRIRRMRQPSANEREEHELTHWPYQEWCDACFKGRARNRQHRRTGARQGEEQGQRIPKVAMDFFYSKAKADEQNEDESEVEEEAVEQAEGHAKPDLIMTDVASGALAVWPLQTKSLDFGDNDWVIKKAGDLLNRWGLLGCDLIWKSDGEPTLLTMKKAMAKFRGGTTQEEIHEEDGDGEVLKGNIMARNFMEESPVAEPQSNEAERAVNKYRPMLKTWKMHIEGKLKTKLKENSPLMKWLKMWVAECYNRTCTGKDGKPAW